MARKRSLLNEDLTLYTNQELEAIVAKITKELDTRISLKAVLEQSRSIMARFSLTPDQLIQMIKKADAKTTLRLSSQETIGYLEKNLHEEDPLGREHLGAQKDEPGPSF